MYIFLDTEAVLLQPLFLCEEFFFVDGVHTIPDEMEPLQLSVWVKQSVKQSVTPARSAWIVGACCVTSVGLSYKMV